MKRRWHSRPIPLFLGLVAFMLVTPEAVSKERLPILGLVAVVLFALGTLAVANHPRLRAVSLGLLLLTVAARVSFVLEPSAQRYLVVEATGCSVLLLTAVALVRVTLAQTQSTGERIEAALAAYLLMGFIWAQAYAILNIVHPGAFRFPDDVAAAGAPVLSRASEHRFLYFSFVTLTTLGYGDITPAMPLARSLSMLEAVAGQLFLAVTIARLVGMRASEEGDRH
jgi:voltage-gated potassium channel